jgi:hypothetical protein
MFTAYDVRKVSISPNYAFDIAPERIARELRVFADKVASGEYILQVVEVKTTAKRGDFAMTHVYFEIHERIIIDQKMVRSVEDAT